MKEVPGWRMKKKRGKEKKRKRKKRAERVYFRRARGLPRNNAL